MIFTGIISGADGLGLSVEKAAAILAEMYGPYLDPGDAIEVLDVDDLTIVQLGATTIRHRGAELDHAARVYLVSNISPCPQRERKLHNVYHLLLELDLALLNRSFAANPELEVNKSLQHAVVAALGIPCVPTVVFDAHAEPADLLRVVSGLGMRFPLVLKPNRLMMGAGILLCENEADFPVKAGIVRRLISDYLMQEYVDNTGDLRVYVSRDAVLGHQLRQAQAHDIRANVSLGGRSTQIELPPELVEQCLRIAAHCDADYLTLDWLRTGSGFLFNEMTSTAAGFTGVPRELRGPMARAVLDIARRKLQGAGPRLHGRSDGASRPLLHA